MTSYDTDIWVNIHLGNGLWLDGTKPLPEPMLTNHPWGIIEFTQGQSLGNTQDIYPWYVFENY